MSDQVELGVSIGQLGCTAHAQLERWVARATLCDALLHQIDPSLEEASINLGVSPLMTFVRLTVPLMMGGVIGGMVLTWVTIASELSSTVVLYSGPWATMTVVMFQALEGTGAGIASAAATVLIVFTVLPVALVYRLLRRHELGMM